jgi:hypothetical protein
MQKQILSGLEKVQLIYKYKLEEEYSNINGNIIVRDELMPDDKEEAEVWLQQFKQ